MNERWQRRSDVLWRRSDERVLLLPTGEDDALLLDGSGCAVWQALAEPRSIAELVDLLAHLHGVAPAAIADDVSTAITALAAHGLVCRRP